MSHLTGKRVAILVTDGFEQSELTEPLRTLREHKADVDIVSLDGGRILLTFDEPQRGPAIGQAAVLYDGDTVVGGGTICGVPYTASV